MTCICFCWSLIILRWIFDYGIMLTVVFSYVSVEKTTLHGWWCTAHTLTRMLQFIAIVKSTNETFHCNGMNWRWFFLSQFGSTFYDFTLIAECAEFFVFNSITGKSIGTNNFTITIQNSNNKIRSLCNVHCAYYCIGFNSWTHREKKKFESNPFINLLDFLFSSFCFVKRWKPNPN